MSGSHGPSPIMRSVHSSISLSAYSVWGSRVLRSFLRKSWSAKQGLEEIERPSRHRLSSSLLSLPAEFTPTHMHITHVNYPSSPLIKTLGKLSICTCWVVLIHAKGFPRTTCHFFGPFILGQLGKVDHLWEGKEHAKSSCPIGESKTQTSPETHPVFPAHS